MKSPAQERKEFLFQAVCALVVLGALVSFNIWYTARGQSVADRRWCDMIVSMDDRYRKLADPAPEAIDLQRSLSVLRADLGCPEPTLPALLPSPAPSRS